MALRVTLAQKRDAVPPDPPPLFFVATDRGRDLQLAVGMPRGGDVRGIEDREVLADDLVGRVVLDPLGPEVPGRDQTRRVEHEDGVVLNALDQETQAQLALPHLLLRLPPLGQVAGDLGEPLQLPVGTADRRQDHVGPEAGAVLAQAPVLVLEATRLLGDGQLPLALAGPDLLQRIEHREVLADDLVDPILLEAHGPRIPGADDAGGIEHEDRVVGHAVHEHPEGLADQPRFRFDRPYGFALHGRWGP